MDKIRSLVQESAEQIFTFRHDLHQIPEPAYTEAKTSQYITDCLARLGLEVQTGIARFGVVGTRTYQKTGKTLLLRSELDALPITEETGLPFTSTHEDAMHACGHDGHMAMVLGAAMVLAKLKPELSGSIKFLFQPAEEGPGGAEPMIAEGVMESPKVDYSLGCHLWPGIAKGLVGIKAGPLMAAMDRFDLTIKGKGGHGAMPHLCVDAIDVAAQIVNALQRIVSRHMNPQHPTVVTVGEFKAGTAFNIIPQAAYLSGTTRTFDPEIWKTWADRIDRVVKGICQAMGATYELNYQSGYPVTTNNPWMAKEVKEVAGCVVGVENVVVPEPSMGGEDMSYFLDRSKGCFFFLGVGSEGGAPLHNSLFDFDEKVLLTGVEIYCRAAIRLLGKKLNI
ncbi:M20 metallopeptidase family protein [Desulfotignum phosphitoxidans]|uniref:Putative amidohydrolase YhaA n=1 Tax=Desulfotignum phosphitoxidans DSM 13687 TaxID=1286635 RepID=S0G781_9BACT|nr:M20 family metallopeptidase [Desulfotignum phosphitoxidans]EMS80942.1 putative amidohydrolase YhaA [Desulfotignum phosphitoxidans DSM 13687]